MSVSGGRKRGLIFDVWDMLKARGSESIRIPDLHIMPAGSTPPSHYIWGQHRDGGSTGGNAKTYKKWQIRLGTAQAPGPAQELCSCIIAIWLAPSTPEVIAREGHSCHRGNKAYLITLTRSWKALSTLRGGSLALVSIYGIWKAKLSLVNLAP